MARPELVNVMGAALVSGSIIISSASLIEMGKNTVSNA
jgi:hypothetical protein